MLNSVQEHSPSSGNSPLAQWIDQSIGRRGIRIQFRIRGNNLLILCEGTPAPNRMVVLNRLVPALHQTDINTLLPADTPRLYHVLLYGRTLGQERPLWAARLYLNQISRHLEQLRQLQPSSTKRSASTARREAGTSLTATHPVLATSAGGSLVLSNRSQAKRGQPDAIARYLSEIISRLGIAVKVNVKTIPYSARAATPNLLNTSAVNISATRRLWIVCEATYSPDPMLVGESMAQRLRDLELEGFRDAMIVIQVVGEPEPDWSLRVDLTPATEMLRDLSRWGDVGAIAYLVKQALSELNVELLDSILKESTLHLSCSKPLDPEAAVDQHSIAEDQDAIRGAIASLLESLGPQGIHAAAVYGQEDEQDVPVWVDWLDLPAAQHSALADPALTLAQNGDWDAIAFLLNRLLNDDLEKQLATGGIRIQLMLKQDLLHVMTDAPICPDQRHVSSTAIKLLKQLKLPSVAGVRVYGRRAGQKQPLWSYGTDFITRQRIVPEAVPEFAATDLYIGDLVAHPGEQIVRPDLTPDDLKNAWARFKQKTAKHLQQVLIRSMAFVPASDGQESGITQAEPGGAKVALIWGAIGLLLAFQADWLLNRALRSMPDQPVAEAAPPVPAPLPVAVAAPTPNTAPVSVSEPPTPLEEPSPAPALPTPTAETPSPAESPDSGDRADSANPDNNPDDKEPGVFNPAGFLRPSASPTASPTPAASPTASPQPSATSQPTQAPTPLRSPSASVVSDDFPFPTFNSRQLDETIALYYQRLEEFGPPDVLVIGSSRALRGVDPAALQRDLAELGYADVSVFNFGINGATAQVVDLVIQRILTPEQLPRLIVWADGARAFNSGAVDVTYNGVVVSEGYRELTEGNLPMPQISQPGSSSNASVNAASGIGASLAASYQDIDRWLSDRLAQLSGTYAERDRLKSLFQSGLAALVPAAPIASPTLTVSQPNAEDGAIADPQSRSLENHQGSIDSNGFLALSMQFNPATYYQKYARVSGLYDSDYEDFQIQGKQDEALRSLLQFTSTRDIPVVFVNLPLTDDYLDPTRLQHEQDFRQYMLSLVVGQQGLIFRDLGELWLNRYDYFSDPSHLNQYGALEVSKRIAEDPMIPWFKPAGNEAP